MLVIRDLPVAFIPAGQGLSVKGNLPLRGYLVMLELLCLVHLKEVKEGVLFLSSSG